DTLMGNSSDPGGGDVLDGGAGSDRMIHGAGTQVVADAADAAPIEIEPLALGGSSLVIQGSDAFRDRIDDDLEVLRSLASGQAILGALDGHGQPVTISEQEDANTATPGAGGAAVEVAIDPQRYDLNASPDSIAPEGPHTLSPSTVLLGHELIHADDMISGRFAVESEQAINGTPVSELTTVGLLPRDGATENDLRAELGMPLRTFYTDPGDLGAVGGDPLAAYRDAALPGVDAET
ncbi:MAG: M91 family zinc metallopeptidase, partial [Acidobacteriota bacterium]